MNSTDYDKLEAIGNQIESLTKFLTIAPSYLLQSICDMQQELCDKSHLLAQKIIIEEFLNI
jgi:hypothetical protein